MTFEKLKKRSSDLIMKINTAVRMNDKQLELELKKELYKTKLEALELIGQEEKRAGVTARALRDTVNSRPTVVRYATGVLPLDAALCGGIEQGTFIQLAGQSFSGKTHLVVEILANISIYAKSVFFNFEMGESRIIQRVNKLFNHENQWDNLIIDSTTFSLKDLIMEITLYARDGIKFFAIDSKMKIDVNYEKDEHKKFAAISKELARLAQQKEIIIILINQMSEDDIKNKRLAFKGSGDQLYDTDIALFYVLNKDNASARTLICTKNRQDEKTFSLDLQLDANNKTILLSSRYQYAN